MYLPLGRRSQLILADFGYFDSYEIYYTKNASNWRSYRTG